MSLSWQRLRGTSAETLTTYGSELAFLFSGFGGWRRTQERSYAVIVAPAVLLLLSLTDTRFTAHPSWPPRPCTSPGTLNKSHARSGGILVLAHACTGTRTREPLTPLQFGQLFLHGGGEGRTMEERGNKSALKGKEGRGCNEMSVFSQSSRRVFPEKNTLGKNRMSLKGKAAPVLPACCRGIS